jgi:hypothetical protein
MTTEHPKKSSALPVDTNQQWHQAMAMIKLHTVANDLFERRGKLIFISLKNYLK